MCGIFGAVNLNGFFSESEYESFVELTDMVQYRGPDASGYLPLDIKGGGESDKSKFDVFLGHRRLSIIDLNENANQPFEYKQDLWITYNGEVFNYVELRNELKKNGYSFRTESDTEVILAVYDAYGADGFSKLNGMWAFAIIDLRNCKIVLSRDRFSIKPLYYFQYDEIFYFASEIKQILPLLNDKDINLSVMSAFLKQGLIGFNHETFFKDIYQVKPMHNITINLRNKGITETRYWDYLVGEYIPDNDDEIIERFRDIFVDSVRIRLRSDVSVGCLLSGGLDSSCISIIANQIENNNINCFSVVSEDKKYSEEKYIDIIKNNTNIKIRKIYLQTEATWDSLEKIIWHNDQPFGRFSVIAQNLALKAIKENSDIKVVLSGQGGDEILCGYKKFFFFYLKEMLKQGNFIELLRNIFFSLIYRTVLWQFSFSDAKRYIPSLQQKGFDSLSNSIIHQQELEPIWEVNSLRDRQLLDIDKYSVPALTHYEDRNSMTYSIEIRLPFLDYRLVNYSLNLCASMKIRNGWPKYILRKSIAGLPHDIAWRRDKQAFITPEEKWLKNDFKENITDLFNSSRLHELGVIRKDQLLKSYKHYVQGSKIISHADITRFVMSEIWARKFL